MTDAEFKTFEKAAKATVKRLSAENTWLRHSLMEMENRVEAMKSQLAELETRAKALKKSLAATPTQTATKSRSKK